MDSWDNVRFDEITARLDVLDEQIETLRDVLYKLVELVGELDKVVTET